MKIIRTWNTEASTEAKTVKRPQRNAIPALHIWYIRFHSSHLAQVLGEKKSDKTTEERCRHHNPSRRLGEGLAAFLQTMGSGAGNAGHWICWRSGLSPCRRAGRQARGSRARLGRGQRGWYWLAVPPAWATVLAVVSSAAGAGFRF